MTIVSHETPATAVWVGANLPHCQLIHIPWPHPRALPHRTFKLLTIFCEGNKCPITIQHNTKVQSQWNETHDMLIEIQAMLYLLLSGRRWPIQTAKKINSISGDNWQWHTNNPKKLSLKFLRFQQIIIIIIISLTSIFFQDKSRVWTAASQQH